MTGTAPNEQREKESITNSHKQWIYVQSTYSDTLLLTLKINITCGN